MMREQGLSKQQPKKKLAPSYVVGVGASAGGLDALQHLFTLGPLNGLCFIVLQHLSPQRESLLPELLARLLHLKVTPPRDKARLQPNHLYVVPPDQHVTIIGSTLHMTARKKQSIALHPIDTFLSSLARAQGSRAIGIILSGTGLDGAIGLSAIRDAGGITFVQNPATAKYTSMPAHALRIAQPDFCLSPAQIATELSGLSDRHDSLYNVSAQQVQLLLARVIKIIHEKFDIDFSRYKDKTLERRLWRRTSIRCRQDINSYVDTLEGDPDELKALVHDMLIGATSFFRNPTAFFSLNQRALPNLIDSKKDGSVLRIWSVGCSSGEEAYSLAICAMRALERSQKNITLQVFATDLSDAAIVKARSGTYEPAQLELVPAAIREAYFTRNGRRYTVRRELREKVIFSRQNALSDPPFSHVDFIACRNLLIYLQSDAQRRLLKTLHYALCSGGYLLLGDSETVGDMTYLFDLLEPKARLYGRNERTSPGNHTSTLSRDHQLAKETTDYSARQRRHLRDRVDHALLRAFSEPGVIIDEDLTIIELRGDLGRYLHPKAGNASLSLQRFLPAGLQSNARRLTQKALQQDGIVTCDTSCTVHGSINTIRLSAVRLPSEDSQSKCVFLRFEEAMSVTTVSENMHAPRLSSPTQQNERRHKGSAKNSAPAHDHVENLERELQVLHGHLDQVVEDYNHSINELKLKSEESQSVNEELRCANEELETSKEEIQSANEELTVVNEEMQNHIDELGLAHEELHNLLLNVEVVAYFVGLDMQLRRYSEAASLLFDLGSSDIGRRTDFVRRMFRDVDIHAIVSRAIDRLTPLEQVLQHIDGTQYLLRVFPSKTLQHTINGALLTFDAVKVPGKHKARVRANNDATPTIVTTADKKWRFHQQPMLALDKDLRCVWGNQRLYARFHCTEATTINKDLTHGALSFLFDNATIQFCRKFLSRSHRKTKDDDRAENRQITRGSLLISATALSMKSGRYLILTLREVHNEVNN